MTISKENIRFTRMGLLAGARRSLPLAVSVFAYGLVFGMLARQAGLSVLEALLMSGLVNAGSSQFVALGLWSTPVPIGMIVLMTLVVNLRHVLMGAALRPWFTWLPASTTYTSLFFLGDENWALTVREFDAGGRDAAFLLGSGLPLFVAWVSSAAVGAILATSLPDPARWGLDFAFTATFVALLIGMWKGRASLLPWGIAASVAFASAHWLGGQWHIVLGGLAGSLAGAWRDAD
ncbi:MAG TPA: AzlC family ABC transporter permease [Gammaproteobacteria bacterium]|nr:AzlC family ABC transporter permease [Gammaproteobacteria bacterium]